MKKLLTMLLISSTGLMFTSDLDALKRGVNLKGAMLQAQYNALMNDGVDDLNTAVYQGDYSKVGEKLALGVDPNHQYTITHEGVDARTGVPVSTSVRSLLPINQAAAQGDLAMVKMLQRGGAAITPEAEGLARHAASNASPEEKAKFIETANHLQKERRIDRAYGLMRNPDVVERALQQGDLHKRGEK